MPAFVSAVSPGSAGRDPVAEGDPFLRISDLALFTLSVCVCFVIEIMPVLPRRLSCLLGVAPLICTLRQCDGFSGLEICDAFLTGRQ